MQEGKTFSAKQISIFTAIDPTREGKKGSKKKKANFSSVSSQLLAEEKAEKLSLLLVEAKRREKENAAKVLRGLREK